MTWKFTWVRSWESLWGGDARNTWERLLATSPAKTVFHLPDLAKAWAETEGTALGVEPAMVFGKHEREGEVMLSLVGRKFHGRLGTRRSLAPMGGEFFGYQDPLASKPGAVDWPKFWSGLRVSAKHVADQLLLRLIHPEHGQGAFSFPCGEESPVLNLEGVSNLEELLAKCSTNHRGDVRRRLRRIAEGGEAHLWIPGENEASEVMKDFRERLLPSYHAVWSQRPAGDMFQRPGVRKFVERVLREGLRDGWGHYTALRVNGETIAWHVGLCWRDEFYWWIPAHDPARENFSPGKVLLTLLLERSIGQKWRRFHFLTGAQRYKFDWKPEPLHLRAIRWHSPTWRGALFGAYDRWVSRRHAAIT